MRCFVPGRDRPQQQGSSASLSLETQQPKAGVFSTASATTSSPSSMSAPSMFPGTSKKVRKSPTQRFEMPFLCLLIVCLHLPTLSVGDPSEGEAQRRLALTTDGATGSPYIHTRYEFDLDRPQMKRSGHGDLWLSFFKGMPSLRWRGSARSPRFGGGDITVVINPEQKVMHSLFRLQDAHEAECMSYVFPDVTQAENVRRLKRLRWRRQKVDELMEEWKKTGSGPRTLHVQWTPKVMLDIVLEGTAVQQVKLRHGEVVFKTVTFSGGSDEMQELPHSQVFGLPGEKCPFAKDVKDPMVRLKQKAPHQRSSALHDFLLMLVDSEVSGESWPELFYVLNAVTIPGDVAVLISDPEPPDFNSLDVLAFEYQSTVVVKGVRHQSQGSIWANLRDRIFRLQGEAKRTKVGPLEMDLVVDGGLDSPEVYANVNLTDEREQQCVRYPYPTMNPNITSQLEAISAQHLQFYAISELDDEDCAIFVAPLARGRWIHLWIDLEKGANEAILRSEVHRAGQVLRSTDVKRWLTSDDIAVSSRPKSAWKCSSDPTRGSLAHLGLNQVHKRSVELQDSLWAIHNSLPEFALREMLGLTGDVSVMVETPDPPQLWRMPAVSFKFSLVNQKHSSDVSNQVSGSFAVDLRRGHLRLMTTVGPARVAVVYEPGFLAMQVREDASKRPVCLSKSLDQRLEESNHLITGAGIFDTVETIGEEICNRFTFVGTGPHQETVVVWMSIEDDVVRRVSIIPPSPVAGQDTGDRGEYTGMLDLREWEVGYHPDELFSQGGASTEPAPPEWGCTKLDSDSWLRLDGIDGTDNPDDVILQTGEVLGPIAEGMAALGLLSPRAAFPLSRIAVKKPSMFKPVNVDMFSNDLRTLSFNFRSMFPLEGRSEGAGIQLVDRAEAEGEVAVDLVRRVLYIKSRAQSVSPGLPLVESTLLFRGDRGQMHTMTKLGEQFQQCWTMKTASSFPAPPADTVYTNPFTRARSGHDGYIVLERNEHHNAQKHVLFLNAHKRVQLFTGDNGKELLSISLEDDAGGSSSGVLVDRWNTGPIDEGIFEPGSEWACRDPLFVDGSVAPEFASWDLLRLFFPDLVYREEVPRRTQAEHKPEFLQ